MSNDLKKKFEQVFDDNHRQLLFHALRFVHDQNDAEDIVAEVFYDLWKRIDDIDLESGIAPISTVPSRHGHLTTCATRTWPPSE